MFVTFTMTGCYSFRRLYMEVEAHAGTSAAATAIGRESILIGGGNGAFRWLSVCSSFSSEGCGARNEATLPTSSPSPAFAKSLTNNDCDETRFIWDDFTLGSFLLLLSLLFAWPSSPELALLSASPASSYRPDLNPSGKKNWLIFAVVLGIISWLRLVEVRQSTAICAATPATTNPATAWRRLYKKLLLLGDSLTV